MDSDKNIVMSLNSLSFGLWFYAHIWGFKTHLACCSDNNFWSEIH